MNKTPGQILYEQKAPALVAVVRRVCLPFVEAGDVFSVPNPVHHAPWHLLTEDCRASWERTAVGHNLVAGAPS